MATSSVSLREEKETKEVSSAIESKAVHVTLLGDSTIDNRVWVDGIATSYIRTKLGITRDTPRVRVRKSHGSHCKPNLSVVEI